MASLRQIRRRLRSIQSTKQIMRAMQLVSGSKLKRAQTKLQQAHGIVEFLDRLRERVLASLPSSTHPLCAVREGQPSVLVVLTSDAGLCGSYNTNLIQLAESYLRRDSFKNTQLISIGKKGHRTLTKRGYRVVEAYLDLAGRPNVAKADAIGRALMQRFLSGQVGSVQLLYSQCVSTSVSRPTVVTWLPIQLQGGRGQETGGTGTSSLAPRPSPLAPVLDYIFEPSPERVLEDLLPRWALAKFQVILLEAFASEHSARMIAMKNATDNAEELLDGLTRQRNKVRQATITKELLEIVGTAEALK